MSHYPKGEGAMVGDTDKGIVEVLEGKTVHGSSVAVASKSQIHSPASVAQGYRFEMRKISSPLHNLCVICSPSKSHAFDILSNIMLGT